MNDKIVIEKVPDKKGNVCYKCILHELNIGTFHCDNGKYLGLGRCIDDNSDYHYFKLAENQEKKDE